MNLNGYIQELRGPDEIVTSKSGEWLLRNPATNKGLAFTLEERRALNLNGLLPAAVQTIGQQVELELEHVRAKDTDLEKYIGLTSLLCRNECLFYRVLVERLEELMPIVYTPTVGEACRKFSHVFRSARAIWLTPDDQHQIPQVLSSLPFDDIRLIVVTDNERILGLGDQGCGGVGIPIGKIALYIAGSGIHPTKTLPISLDVGTNNPTLLEDPLYAGYRKRRLRGEAYDEFIEAFVEGVRQVFPKAVVQWEDFHKSHAYALLERYRKRVPCFNDDIQGTAAVTVAGIYAALKITREDIRNQRVLYLGAGEASTGIATLMRAAMRDAGADANTIRKAQILYDTKGLLCESREIDEPFKREFAARTSDLSALGVTNWQDTPLPKMIDAFKPTILVGACATPGAFTQEIVETMGRHCRRPIIFPLSNPTSKAECAPCEALTWTDGRAIVATGSPFAPVDCQGRRIEIGQANNVFVFPGIGMGAIISEIREVTDEIFLIAAKTLAECVSAERLERGAIFPRQSELREVSARIATAIVRYASKNQLGRQIPLDSAEAVVRGAMWNPDYIPVRRAKRHG